MNICIVMLDCLRADHLSCYGYGKNTSPNIDEIATSGLVFENAISQSNWTYPSLYSMMTGRYPSSIGISWWDQRINDNTPVLPDILSKKGFHTGLITSFKGLLNPNCFCGHFQETRQLKIKDNLPSAFRDWVQKNDKSFLLLHIGEYIHEPFFADRKDIERYLSPGVDINAVSRSQTVDSLTSRAIAPKDMRKVIAMINQKLARLSHQEIAYLIASYDAGISFVDTIVAEFYSIIKETQKEYMFILLADHGQGFLEHGVLGHGLTLYEELIHVPLIIDLNGERHVRISEPTQLMDLFPTILEILGIRHDNVIDGVSLVPLFNGSTLGRRGVVCEGYPYLCLRSRDKKLITKYSRLQNYAEIYNPVAKSWKRRLLTKILHYLPDKVFDLSADPLEKKNLARKNNKLYTTLHTEINELARRFTVECKPSTEVGIDEEILKQLKELGYI